MYAAVCHRPGRHRAARQQRALFPPGAALLVIGLMLEAGATGAVKAIKMSAKLLADRSPDTPGDRAASLV